MEDEYMRMLIQRVREASVSVDGEITGKIGHGLLVFVGTEDSDTEEIADKMLKKLVNLRIFADAEGKTNLSLLDVGGELLLVSQFTLYADCRKGNRPSFIKAGAPEYAEKLYHYLVKQAGEIVETVQEGIFAASMQVSLLNDGPFTIWLDSAEIVK